MISLNSKGEIGRIVLLLMMGLFKFLMYLHLQVEAQEIN